MTRRLYDREPRTLAPSTLATMIAVGFALILVAVATFILFGVHQ